MAKKRPTLDAFLTAQTSEDTDSVEAKLPQKISKQAKITKKTVADPKVSKRSFAEPKQEASADKGKPEIIRHMLYLPVPVYDQLQDLIFQEQRGQSKRRKTHDYLLDAIDLLFKEKGLKSIDELAQKNK